MANASHDENSIPTKTGVLNTDGTTVMKWYVNPSNGGLKISDGTTGVYPGGTNAARDDNDQPTALGVSSADGVARLKVLVNSSNQVLVKST